MYNTLTISTNATTVGSSVNGLSNYSYQTSSIPAIHYGGTDISKSFIGWDSTVKEIEKLGERMIKNSGNFPPYNVIKVDEDTYLIEFAVAGFTKENVKVSQEKNALIIEGSMHEDEDREYLHKGIATRSFNRVIALAEHVEVIGAEFKNGILTVTVERIVPEEEQPKVIKIK